MKKYIRKILLVIGLSIIFITVFKIRNSNRNSYSFTQINEVQRENIVFNYDFQGFVVSKKEVLIYSPLQGDIKKVHFRLGDEVKKEDVLVEIDENALSEMNNSIIKAKINLNKINKKYEDALELYNVGAISKSELQDAKDNLTIANLDFNELVSKSKEVSNLIKSTVSGTIIESNVDENFKIDQSKHLYKIVDTENLKIIAEIPNSKVVKFKIGDEVKISATSLSDGNTIIGKIDEISKISTKSEKFNDTVTKVTINLEPNSGLKPGDIVDMEVIFSTLKNVLTINYSDLIVNGDEKYVFVVDKNNKVRKVNVVVGENNSVKYEVKKGLNEGDRVINNLDGQYKEGDIIK